MHALFNIMHDYIDSIWYESNDNSRRASVGYSNIKIIMKIFSVKNSCIKIFIIFFFFEFYIRIYEIIYAHIIPHDI